MQLIYAPEGADSKRWEFEPNKIMSPEAEAIERATGWTYAEFGQQFLKGSTTARHAFLWIMLKRKTPSLKFDEVQFAMNEVDVVWSDDEMRAIVKALAERQASGGLSDDEEKLYEAIRDVAPAPEEEATQEAAPLPETASGVSHPEV